MKLDRDDGTGLLSDTLISNDSPVEVVDKVISGYIPPKHMTANEEIKPIEQINCANMLKVPYIKGFSDTLNSDLKTEGIDIRA